MQTLELVENEDHKKVLNIEAMAQKVVDKTSKSQFTIALLSSLDQKTIDKVKAYKWRETKCLTVAIAIYQYYYTTFIRLMQFPDHHRLLLTKQVSDSVVKLYEWSNYTTDWVPTLN